MDFTLLDTTPSLAIRNLMHTTLGLCLFISHPCNAKNLDWVPNTQPATHYCAGYYRPPAILALDTHLLVSEQPIYAQADASKQQHNITTLKGNVILQQGKRTWHSETIQLNSNTDLISTQDHMTYRQPGLLITASSSAFNTKANSAQLQQTELLQHNIDLRVTAQQLIINADNTMRLDAGRFTFCPPGNNSWHIYSQQVAILPDQGVGEAHNAVLKVGQVPIFYWPWFSFPVDDTRRSGFLPPRLSTSSIHDFSIATPYYLNLASNYDSIITPHLLAHGDGHMTANSRLLDNRQAQHTSRMIWSMNKQQTGGRRWYLDYTYDNFINNRLKATIYLARASDIALFDDYNYRIDQVDKNKITSRMEFNYQPNNIVGIDDVNLRLTKHQQRTNSTASYHLMPHIDMEGKGKLANNSQWQYRFSYDYFRRSNGDLTGMSRINGQRVHFIPSIRYHWQTPYAYLTPGLYLPISHYNLTDTPTDVAARQDRSVVQWELDSGLFFDRTASDGQQQTLEPRLYWTHTPYVDQDNLPVFDISELSKPLYQPNRFLGPDRIGDTHRITLSLSSRLLNTKGQQQAKFSLAQMHYLSHRQVQLSSTGATATETSSPFYGQMDYRFNSRVRGAFSADWRAGANMAESVSANVLYKAANNQVISANYTQTPASAKQSQMSGMWPITSQWLLFAQHKLNLKNHQTLDQIMGLEYANCCWKARLVRRDWLVDQTIGNNHSLFLELQLKGLGNDHTRLFGRGSAELESFMKNITGYHERFK